MDAQLKKAQDDIIAGSWLKRRGYLKDLIVSIIPFVVNALIVYTQATYNFYPPILSPIIALALIITLLIALGRGGRFLGRVIDPLDPVEKSFEILYTALTYNDPDPGERYSSVVQEHIHKLMQSVAYQLREENTPSIILEEVEELLERTEDNIDKRLVPASRIGDLTPETMRQLARLLAKPSIDDLKKLNSDIETTYMERDKEGIDVGARLSRFFSGKKGDIVRSLVFGFGITIFASVGYAFLTQQDFVVFARANPAVILGGAFALTVGYLAYLTKTA